MNSRSGTLGIGLLADDVWLRYSSKRPWALAGASVSIPTGSLVALVGANGAGKTTLFRSWLGFERPDRGSVHVLGFDPGRDREAALSAMAYVAQEPALYAALSCRDHLRFAGLQRPGFGTEAALAALEAAAVPVDAKADTLSGGQRVQLSLAIARGCDARVLLLDEPLANLDPIARRTVMLAMSTYAHDRDATVLVSSHLVSDLEGTFDRLVLMAAGSVLLSDSVASIVARASVEPTDPGVPVTVEEIGRFVGRDGQLRRVRLAHGTNGGTDDGSSSATLEDIILGMMATNAASASPSPSRPA